MFLSLHCCRSFCFSRLFFFRTHTVVPFFSFLPSFFLIFSWPFFLVSPFSSKNCQAFFSFLRSCCLCLPWEVRDPFLRRFCPPPHLNQTIGAGLLASLFPQRLVFGIFFFNQTMIPSAMPLFLCPFPREAILPAPIPPHYDLSPPCRVFPKAIFCTGRVVPV